MTMSDKPLNIIGRVERIDFPETGVFNVPARIDTGAKTAAVWASNIQVTPQGLSFCLFGPSSKLYTGEKIIVKSYTERVVSSSNGHASNRYAIRLLVRVDGRNIRALFTLADRSTQVYPVLIGRNDLRGKFVVDVTKGSPIVQQEKAHTDSLQQNVSGERG
jgi:hypothetical protein